MKIIVFGIGSVWKAIKPSVDFQSILCFCDNDPKYWGQKIAGKEIVSPQKISSFPYDFIVIASTRYFCTIRQQLTEDFRIDPRKIISWVLLLQCCISKPGYYNPFSFKEMLKLIDETPQNKILLDYDLSFVKYRMFTKEIEDGLSFGGQAIFGYTQNPESVWPIFQNVYTDLYTTPSDLEKKTWDTVLLGDFAVTHSIDVSCCVIRKLLPVSRAIFFSYQDPLLLTCLQKAEEHLTIRRLSYYHSDIAVVEKKNESNEIDLKLFVAVHKMSWVPDDPLYVPIHVGSGNFSLPRMVRDDTGDNIASYNAKINEGTAMYWIWKNVDCQYVGLNHYRRYFLKNRYKSRSNLLDLQTASAILRDYDIILAPKVSTCPQDIRCQLSATTGHVPGLEAVRAELDKRHPDYLPAFDYVFSGECLYVCNLFITSKKTFDAYCAWLFDFILPACGRIDTRGYDIYSSRIAGFILERMLTVWLTKQKLKIKELPYLLLDEQQG